jgi:neutral ceramidase
VRTSYAICVGLLVLFQQASGIVARAETTLKLEFPQPYQVIQRTGVAPGAGYAPVMVRCELPQGVERAHWEFRVITQAAEPPIASDWTQLTPKIEGTIFETTARVAAGGWYRLELRGRANDVTVAVGAVEPIGVGEIFVVAGQSYATNCNDDRMKVADPQARVVAFDSVKATWVVANDPQPAPDGSDGGSIWPPLGDALVRELRVPVGFVNVAVGGTSSTQWLPDGKLHPRLVQAGRALGRFRAVLWQQGESDVIGKTTIERYVANLTTIRETSAKAWGAEPPWLLAKSTHHPTVYRDPEGEGRIRGAIDELLKRPGFKAGPDTDTLQGENRGDAKSRRHFSAIGQRRAADMWLAAIRREVLPDLRAEGSLRVGLAEVDITPPAGFPMAGYYHERLADGASDSLKAKAIVFRDGKTAAALVVCDLIGIATDLSRAVRQRSAEKTAIPASNIVISATHSHTAPDYMKELWLHLGGERQDPMRKAYIEKLIDGLVEVIVKADAAAKPAVLEYGSATPHTPVAFNRRFVMRDGSVKTWQNFENRDVVRSAGPIDPEIGLLTIRDETGKSLGILSNFALHLDTVGGLKWSADYPYFIEQTLRKAAGADVISIFGTGCCGDINHANPRSRQRNKADFIGNSIGASIQKQLGQLEPIERPDLIVKSRVVKLLLAEVTKDDVARSIQVLQAARRKETVEFLDHVTAYKMLMLDQLRRREPHANASEHITWGLCRSLAGVGEALPVEVTVMTLGRDVAVVCLPGEVFVELGLAIKLGSPFRTTLVIELSNSVETIYIPHRAAYAGGSYEVTNSALQPGSGEMLVEAALRLLREAAAAR